MLNDYKVIITAGLQNLQLTDPAVGGAATSHSTGFTDGDIASDSYIQLNGTTPVALNGAGLSTRGGFIKIVNPSAFDVTIKIGTTTMGTLKGVQTVNGVVDAPVPCVFPVDAGVVVNAMTTAAQTPTIGVTLVQITPNA